MKAKTLILSVILLMLNACGEKINKELAFQKEVVTFLSEYYLPDGEKEYDISNSDSLRGELFFSKDLIHAIVYYFKKETSDSSNEINYASFTLYEYSNIDIAKTIVQDFQVDKNRRTTEGWYGPIDKDYSCFFQASKYVIHFEATCKYADEKDWMNVQDFILKIANKYYSPIALIVTKPCE